MPSSEGDSCERDGGDANRFMFDGWIIASKGKGATDF